VIAYERGAFGELEELPPMRTPLSDIYVEAVQWANDTVGTIA
jgi:hypothetical protein